MKNKHILKALRRDEDFVDDFSLKAELRAETINALGEVVESLGRFNGVLDRLRGLDIVHAAMGLMRDSEQLGDGVHGGANVLSHSHNIVSLSVV